MRIRARDQDRVPTETGKSGNPGKLKTAMEKSEKTENLGKSDGIYHLFPLFLPIFFSSFFVNIKTFRITLESSHIPTFSAKFHK